MLGSGPWDKGRPEMWPGILDQGPLGLTGLWDVSWSCPGIQFERLGVSWSGPGGVPGRPGGVLGRPWRPLGSLLERLARLGRRRRGFQRLMERSWEAVGVLSGPKKSSLERLLAAPREIPRQVSTILGAKRLPKGRPRGSKIDPKRGLELKMAKP